MTDWRYFQHNGHNYRVTATPDLYTSYTDMDAESCGPIEWIKPSDPQPQRPDGFNGRARKLTTDERGQAPFWWQPSSDISDDVLADVAEYVRTAVTHGYAVLTLELLRSDDVDVYGAPIAADHATLDGVGWETVEECIPYGDDPDPAAFPLADLIADIAPAVAA